ncbi:MAG TPA: nucleoside-triphosphatase [Symbiobacteriaceae bacterium]
MKLLLMGVPRCGKSTLIRRLAEQYPGNAGGCLSVPLVGPDGRRIGFEAQAVWHSPGEPLRVVQRATLARTDLPSDLRSGRYGVDPAGLDLCVRALDAAMHEGGLVLIDEIGPIQILSPAFRDAVLRCLCAPNRVLGAISGAPDPFLEEIRTLPGIRLLEVTRENRQHLFQGLLPWMLIG